MNQPKTDNKKIVVIVTEPPQMLKCYNCNRETLHNFNRIGVNGKIFTCSCCGSEKTA
ncbi:MAG TPA: hypothetical protein VIY48_13620 [Candidatus Paceibacterota bacterium]